MKNALIVNARKIEKLAKETMEMLAMLEELCVRECRELPKGKLHASKRGKYVAYYRRPADGTGTEEYIPKERVGDAKKLALREYDEAILKAVRRQKYHLRAITNIEEELNTRNIPQTKLEMIDRKLLTDQEYITAWEQEPFHGKKADEITTEYYTVKGEHVRSKSECLIANTLHRMNIPYKYEAECVVRGYNNYHPDFTCINARRRHPVIWEHFGMINDSNYAESTTRKIKKLIMMGYKLGEDFIFTMETPSEPLSTRVIEQMIVDYLL